MLYNLIDEDRVRVIGNVLAELDFEGMVKFDFEEPEYKAFKRICENGVSPEYIGLIALSAGVIDYQLGSGGTYEFWRILVDIYSKSRVVGDVDDVEKIMYRFMNMPVNRRLYNQKLQRIERIFRSGFAEWFIKEYDALCEEPFRVWRELSYILYTGMERKTVVFAMKAWDLSNLACHGKYLDYPWDIPIPVDTHVKDITVSSGIMKTYGRNDVCRDAWIKVLKIARGKLDRNITLLRVDSLVWQAGKIISEEKFDKRRSRKSLYRYFTEKIGLDDKISNKLSIELTIFIGKLKSYKYKYERDRY